MRNATIIINIRLLRLNPTNKYLGGNFEITLSDFELSLLSLVVLKLSGKVNLKCSNDLSAAQYHAASEAESFKAGINNGS
jgi:hypothetical protein